MFPEIFGINSHCTKKNDQVSWSLRDSGIVPTSKKGTCTTYTYPLYHPLPSMYLHRWPSYYNWDCQKGVEVGGRIKLTNPPRTLQHHRLYQGQLPFIGRYIIAPYFSPPFGSLAIYFHYGVIGKIWILTYMICKQVGPDPVINGVKYPLQAWWNNPSHLFISPFVGCITPLTTGRGPPGTNFLPNKYPMTSFPNGFKIPLFWTPSTGLVPKSNQSKKPCLAKVLLQWYHPKTHEENPRVRDVEEHRHP